MEDKVKSPASVAIGYAPLLSLVLIVLLLVLYLLNVPKDSWLTNLTFVILVAGIVIVQLNYRNKNLGGFISYGKAFNVGFLLALFTAIVMLVWTYIYYKFIDLGGINDILSMQEEKFVRRGMTDMEIEQSMSFMRKFASPGIYAFGALISYTFMGLIISLITSIFTKREGPPHLPVA